MQHKAIDLLGLGVTDKVTGFQGIVTSVSFDLYGCIQALVCPKHEDPKDKRPDSWWFDITRLRIDDRIPIIDLPDFNDKRRLPGPADKPTKY